MRRALLIATLALLAIGLTAQLGSAQSGGSPAVDELSEVGVGRAAAPAPDALQPSRRVPSADAAERGRKRGKQPLLAGFTTPLGTTAAEANEARSVNAEVVRIFATWRSIAPQNRTPAFQPSKPGSPEYNWGALDAAVRQAKSRGFRVILNINRAPRWAEGRGRPSSVAVGSWKPNPKDVADFGTAIAKRYAGNFRDRLGKKLPRVKDFMLWNEPNLESNLTPQWTGANGKQSAAPSHYRLMLNAFYKAVSKIRGTKVITGGTSPYGTEPGGFGHRPLLFWRRVLCLKGSGSHVKAMRCKTKPKFDVLAHQPINTSGGPTRSALDSDDVSTPDLHNLVHALRKAEKAHNVGTKGRHPVWVTELWWETDPPDPGKPPDQLTYSPATQARFYAQSLYLLWKQGASMVLFLQVRDSPYDGNPGRVTQNLQSGVFFANGKAKPSAQAVRFPFVADRKSKRKVVLWGKAPGRGKVVVQKRKGNRYKSIARFKKLKPGEVFTKTVKLRGKKTLRARAGKRTSLNWQLR